MGKGVQKCARKAGQLAWLKSCFPQRAPFNGPARLTGAESAVGWLADGATLVRNVMRPNSIRWFDKLFLAAMALEFLLRVTSIEEALHIVHRENIPIFVTIYAVSFLIVLAFWISISRFRSIFAKWAWTAWLIGCPTVFLLTAVQPEVIFQGGLKMIAFEIVRPVLYLGATAMLFRSDAKAWFGAHSRRDAVNHVS